MISFEAARNAILQNARPLEIERALLPEKRFYSNHLDLV